MLLILVSAQMKQAESEYFTYLLKKTKKTHKWNKDIFSLKKKIDMKKKNTLYQEKKKRIRTLQRFVC